MLSFIESTYYLIKKPFNAESSTLMNKEQNLTSNNALIKKTTAQVYVKFKIEKYF